MQVKLLLQYYGFLPAINIDCDGLIYIYEIIIENVTFRKKNGYFHIINLHSTRKRGLQRLMPL